MIEFAIDAFTQVMQIALPIAVVFEIGNIIVGTFMRAAFGGKLWFGR